MAAGTARFTPARDRVLPGPEGGHIPVSAGLPDSHPCPKRSAAKQHLGGREGARGSDAPRSLGQVTLGWPRAREGSKSPRRLCPHPGRDSEPDPPEPAMGEAGGQRDLYGHPESKTKQT